MSFGLTLFQVAMQESSVGVVKGGLRAVATTTGQPAGEDDQKGKDKNRGLVSSFTPQSANALLRYGCVRPLEVALAALTVPPPMQPRCMFSMFSVK